MGLARQFVIRALLYLIAMIATIVGSLVLIRKLEPEDYAYYQGLTKRVFQIGWFPFLAASPILYRRLVVRSRDSLSTWIFYVLASIVSLLLTALAWGLHVGVTHTLLILSLATAGGFGLWEATKFVLNAWRPVMVSLHIFITRIFASTLVILLVYLYKAGVTGALISITIAYILGTLLAIRLISEKISTVSKLRYGQYIKRAVTSTIITGYRNSLKLSKRFSRTILLQSINSILSGVDVFIAISLKTLSFTAPFLAFQSILNLVNQSISWASQLFARNLLTGESREKDITKALRFSLILTSPLYILPVTIPDQIASLLNPIYAPHASLLTILGIGHLVLAISTIYNQIAYGSIPQNTFEETLLLNKLFKKRLYALTVYIIMLTILLESQDNSEKALLLWGFSFLSYAIMLGMAGITQVERPFRNVIVNVTLGSLSKSIPVSLVLSLPLAFLVPPPDPRFWNQLLMLAPPLVVYYISYIGVMLLLDSELRGVFIRFFTKKV